MVDEKVVLITGGSRGIGAALVEKFVQQGAAVAFTYKSSREESEAIAERLSKTTSRPVKAYQSDAASFTESSALIEQVLKDFERIDVLINNAGITRDNLMLRMSEEHWDQVMDNNLKSVFNLTKPVLRPMLKQRSGSIINMTSVVGIFGNAGQANYAASKAGIIGFTKSVAKELASRNIRCNAIAPGFVETEMTDSMTDQARENIIQSIPLNRLGSGKDIANAAIFLASDQSTYITGQVLSVCGGLNI